MLLQSPTGVRKKHCAVDSIVLHSKAQLREAFSWDSAPQHAGANVKNCIHFWVQCTQNVPNHVLVYNLDTFSRILQK